jgi:hypothetical protein
MKMGKSKYFRIDGVIQIEDKKISQKKFFEEFEKFLDKNSFTFGGGFCAIKKNGKVKKLKN